MITIAILINGYNKIRERGGEMKCANCNYYFDIFFNAAYGKCELILMNIWPIRCPACYYLQSSESVQKFILTGTTEIGKF